MKNKLFLLSFLSFSLLFSCTNTKVVYQPVKQSNYVSSQRALAEMAKGWTQEERDAFKRDFFYSEKEINEIDSLINK